MGVKAWRVIDTSNNRQFISYAATAAAAAAEAAQAWETRLRPAQTILRALTVEGFMTRGAVPGGDPQRYKEAQERALQGQAQVANDPVEYRGSEAEQNAL